MYGKCPKLRDFFLAMDSLIMMIIGKLSKRKVFRMTGVIRIIRRLKMLWRVRSVILCVRVTLVWRVSLPI